MTPLLRGLDRLIGQFVAAAKWLALPLILLLFLQWPLRDLLHKFSREANDLGQVAFALFVAVSVTVAVAVFVALAMLGLVCWFICAKIEPAVRGAMTQTISYFGLLPERLPASRRPAFSRGLGLRLSVPAKMTDTLR